MTRSQLASWAGRSVLLLLLAVGSGHLAHAQGAVEADSARQQPAPTTSAWKWGLVLLLGAGLGVLGSRLLRSKPATGGAAANPAIAGPVAAPPVAAAKPMVQGTPRENRPVAAAATSNKARSGGKGGGRSGESEAERQERKRMEQQWRNKNLTAKPTPPARKPAENRPMPSENTQPKLPNWTVTPSPMAPQPPTAEKPLSLGQTVDLTPTPSLHELIDATAPSEATAPQPAAPPQPSGPVQYYAPAPDVPSIEHRKLSPNPLPQMPLLVVLAHAEATAAQFSFSPQADQSRIIGNGVRELKEFFQFELPPTEQFTTIKNLTPGQLEKRDEAWHVVQKASIALS